MTNTGIERHKNTNLPIILADEEDFFSSAKWQSKQEEENSRV